MQQRDSNLHTANWGMKCITLLTHDIEGLKWVNGKVPYEQDTALQHGTVVDMITQKVQSEMIDIHGKFTDTGILTETDSKEIASMLETKTYPLMKDIVMCADRLNYLNDSDFKTECTEMLQSTASKFCDMAEEIVRLMKKAAQAYSLCCPAITSRHRTVKKT